MVGGRRVRHPLQRQLRPGRHGRPPMKQRLALGALLLLGCARGVVEQPPGPGDVDAAPPADAPPPPRPDAPPADRAPERPLSRDTAPAEVPVGCGVANIVTRSFFDGIFPAAGRNSVFTYEGFI